MPKNPTTRFPKPKATRGGEGSSVRYDLRVYVYSDGHGNITGRDEEGEFNLPVDGGDEAMAQLAKIWRSGRQAAARAATKRRRTSASNGG